MKTTYFYDPETHVSVCEIKKGNNTYTGTVDLYPEDMDVVSSYAGCVFAEAKAKRQMYKDEHKELKRELKTLKTLYLQISQLKSFSDMEHSQVCQFIRKQIKIKNNEVIETGEKIHTLTILYPDLIENRLAKAREIPAILECRDNRKAILEMSSGDE